MADQVYLSCWLRGFTERKALPAFEVALSQFPFSRLAPAATLRVHAIAFSEPPLLEQRFEQETEAADIVDAAHDFENADCAYLIETAWDLLQYERRDWRLRPAPVTITCFAPEFETEYGDQIRVEFGPDSLYMPDEDSNLFAIQSNIRSLLRYAEDLRAALPVEKALLWSESGGNLAERLRETLEEV